MELFISKKLRKYIAYVDEIRVRRAENRSQKRVQERLREYIVLKKEVAYGKACNNLDSQRGI